MNEGGAGRERKRTRERERLTPEEARRLRTLLDKLDGELATTHEEALLLGEREGGGLDYRTATRAREGVVGVRNYLEWRGGSE